MTNQATDICLDEQQITLLGQACTGIPQIQVLHAFVLTATVQLPTVIVRKILLCTVFHKNINLLVIMENNYHPFIKPRQEMMMSVLGKFYYMYKHHPYSYICLLLAQNLSAYPDSKAVFSSGDYQPGDISHALFCLFSKFLIFFLLFVIGRMLLHSRSQRSQFELHLLKHIKTFMDVVLQKLSNLHVSLNHDAY